MNKSESAEDTIELIEDAIKEVLATRDFCGDEHFALRMWQLDNRELSDVERSLVLSGVEREWKASQIAAGVKSELEALRFENAALKDKNKELADELAAMFPDPDELARLAGRTRGETS